MMEVGPREYSDYGVDATIHTVEEECATSEVKQRGSGIWDKITHPFSYDGRKWENLTTDLEAINKQIDTYNGKNILAIGILIIAVCTCSIFYIVIGVVAASLILGSDEDLKREILLFKVKYGPIEGGNKSDSEFFVKKISVPGYKSF